MIEAESVLLHTFEQENKSAKVLLYNSKYFVVYREMIGDELARREIEQFDNELNAELFAEILIEGV
jgi:hypothetical protein